jgi:hypothetical protein
MANDYSTATKNAMVDALIARGRYYSIHSASPAGTGANEVSSARQQMTFPSASAGAAQGSTVAIAIPIGVTTAWFGVWDALSGGNYIRGGTLPATSVFGAPGTLNLSDLVVYQ